MLELDSGRSLRRNMPANTRKRLAFNQVSKQWFPTVEALYKARLNALLAVASRYVYNKDLALDMVHDALAKSLAYFQKHPERKIRENIVHLLIIKACKKANKTSVEVPYGLMNGYEPINE